VKKVFRISTVPVSLNILLKGQLAFFHNHYSITAVSGSGKDLEEVKIREGVNIYSINMSRNISLIKDLLSLIKLYSYFKKEKPLIVHSITPKAGLSSMIAAKFARVPIRMHTFTGLIFPSKTGLMQKLLIKMDKLLCWAATNVYPEGNGVKDDLINYRITNKPLKVLANGNINGVDLYWFNPESFADNDRNILRKELNIRNDDFVFILVGRLVGDKGINELIEAFENIRKKNVKLLLVGSFENELDPLSKETLTEIESNPNIISVGYQPDVRPYFAISDALAFPSYREGFPNVVMQAGAMGLPSIVTDINGCNEIVEEGVNGLIIPAKDSMALQEAMVKLMTDKELYSKLKKNAREMIVSRYEQKMVWNALLDEYKRLTKDV